MHLPPFRETGVLSGRLFRYFARSEDFSMAFDFQVLLRQMLSFYTLIAVGFLSYRIRLFHEEELAALSRLTVRVFLPIMVFTTILNTVQRAMLPQLPPFLFSLTLAFFIMLGIGWCSGRLLRLKSPTLGVHTAAVGLSNDGFIGYPLWLAVFPDRSGLAIMCACILYVLAQWTVSYPLTIPRGSGVTFHWKKMITPPLIATFAGTILVLCGACSIEGVVWDTLTAIGGCTKYVGMLYIGGVLAQKGLRRLFSRPALFLMAPIKMIAGPLVVYLLLGLLPFLDRTQLLMIVMMSAVPAPMIVCIQAAMNHSDEEYAVGSMVLTTLVCLGTIPLVMYLVTLF